MKYHTIDEFNTLYRYVTHRKTKSTTFARIILTNKADGVLTSNDPAKSSQNSAKVHLGNEEIP